MPVAELITAIKNGDASAVGALLDQDPALLGARTAEGPSAILLAMYYRHPEIAGEFIRRGAALDIFEACAAGTVERARELLRADPDLVRAVAPDGFTPLTLAAYFGHPEVAALLVDAGAEVNAPSHNALRVAPINSAVAGGSRDVVRMLLERGADPNARQQSGETPLHAAAFGGDEVMVKLLLAAGADPSASMEDGRTPADLAREKGHAAVADLLATITNRR